MYESNRRRKRKKGESMAENMKGRGKNMKVFFSRKYEKLCSVCRKGVLAPVLFLLRLPLLSTVRENNRRSCSVFLEKLEDATSYFP
jgi:hypothetical protein